MRCVLMLLDWSQIMNSELRDLLMKAYTPHDDLKFACIVRMDDGTIFKGVSVKNSVFRDGIYAEQIAIASAITAGYKKGDFKEINVMVSSGSIGTPCFVCRQLLNEFFDEDACIRCFSTNGEYREYQVKELCPYPFGSVDLK